MLIESLIPPEFRHDLQATEGPDPDAAASLRKIEGRLQRVAAHRSRSMQMARKVARCYFNALSSRRDPHAREQQWRDFIVALQTFVALHPLERSRDVSILESIVAENADLLRGATK